MDALRWIAPAALAVVFAFAAGAKLSRPSDTQRSFEALGLPAPTALSWGVPVVELGVAVLLIAAPPVGATLAIVVLAAFSAFLTARLVQGDETPCACFGRARVRAISISDLARNTVLISLAVVALLASP